MVAFKKWQGPHHYPDPGCQPEDNLRVSMCGCCIEDEMIGMGKCLRARNPEIQVLEYMNSQQASPLHRLGHEVAANPNLGIHDNDGEIVKASGGRFSGDV
jgi:hypothetical protein